MRRWRLIAVAIAVVGVALAAVVLARRWPTAGVEDPGRMVEAILARCPAGTPVGDARRFMEREGFDSTDVAGGEFLDRRGIDYVYCDRSTGGVVQRRWQVAIVHRDGKLVEVLASTGMVGP